MTGAAGGYQGVAKLLNHSIGLTDDAFPGTVQTMKLSDTRLGFQAIRWIVLAVILAILVPLCAASTAIRIWSPEDSCQNSLRFKGLCPQGANHHDAPAPFLPARFLPMLSLDAPWGLFAPDHGSHPALAWVRNSLRDRAPPIA